MRAHYAIERCLVKPRHLSLLPSPTMHILGRVILDTKKQHMCVMNTTKHLASYQFIIHPKCGWFIGPNVFGHHPIFFAKNMNPGAIHHFKMRISIWSWKYIERSLCPSNTAGFLTYATICPWWRSPSPMV
jgi:hypothetical protein